MQINGMCICKCANFSLTFGAPFSSVLAGHSALTANPPRRCCTSYSLQLSSSAGASRRATCSSRRRFSNGTQAIHTSTLTCRLINVPARGAWSVFQNGFLPLQVLFSHSSLFLPVLLSLPSTPSCLGLPNRFVLRFKESGLRLLPASCLPPASEHLRPTLAPCSINGQTHATRGDAVTLQNKKSALCDLLDADLAQCPAPRRALFIWRAIQLSLRRTRVIVVFQ